jgi:hypothetical protein
MSELPEVPVEQDSVASSEAAHLSAPLQRAALAEARAAELGVRLLELAAGAASDVDTAGTARRHAEHAAVRAAQSLDSALHRHVEAGRAHLGAAAAHEQAAMFVNDDDCEQHQTAAARHRAAAAEHDSTVARLTPSEK